MTSGLALLYWTALTGFAAASVLLAGLAWRRQASPWVIGASAATLLVALVIASQSAPVTDIPTALDIIITVIAVAISVIGGGPAATVVLSLATKNSVTDGEHGGIMVKDEPGEVLRGGLTIGLLERLAATAAILAGQPGAIGVIVAIKGVGRFSELDAAETRERFIIGTLTSLGWACACGALVVLAAG